MDKPLRILILEDNPADAELVQFELEEGGIAFTACVVATENDFVRNLRDFAPDLILSDYDLPRYSGARALAEAKRRSPDIPFILVTGAVSEDRAIEILTSGAKDYVMKSRLNRLAPAVLRALAEAREQRARKEAEEELRAASRYSRSLIETSLDPLVTISPDGKFMDVNRATEKITGVSRDQLIGKDFADYFTEPEKARAAYQKAFLEGSVKDYALQWRHTSGQITNVLYNASTYADEKGEVQGVFAATRDVTELVRTELELREIHRNLENKVRERTRDLKIEIEERKKIEEALRESERHERERAMELEALLDAVPTPVFVAQDPDCLHITGNRAADELLKMPPLSETSLSAPPDVRPRHFRAVKDGRELQNDELPAQRAARGIPVQDFEFSLVFDDGAVRHVLGYGTPLYSEEGHPRGAVQALVDITERKRAEDALRQSEERFRLILQANLLGTFEVDLLTGESHWNETEFELFGLRRGDAPEGPDTFFRFVHPDDREMMTRQWEMAKQTGKLDAEFRIIRADGQERWMAGKGRFIFVGSQNGNAPAAGRKVVRFMGVNFDITERKRAEEETRRLLDAIRQEKDKLAALVSSMNDEVWLADTEKRFTLANPSALREFSLNGEDVNVEKLAAGLEVYRPDGSLRPVEEAPPLRALRGEVVRNEEEIIRTPATGELRYRRVSSSPVRDAEGAIIGSVSVARDVTERKHSEQRWATTLASIGDGVIVADTGGKITFLNPAAEKLTGWSIKEALSQPISRVFNTVDELSRRKTPDPVALILRDGAAAGLADHTLLVRKDGTEISIDDSGAPITDKSGHTLGAVLVFRDNTQKRQLQSQMAHIASFVMLNPHPVMEIDLTGVVHFMNPAAENLFPDLRMRGLSHPWFAGSVQLLSGTPESSGQTASREIQVGDRWYGQTMLVLSDPLRIRIYGRSITKRKLAEAALQASEEGMRYALQASHTGAWKLNLSDFSSQRSREHDRIFGYPEGLPSWTYEMFLEHVLPEDRGTVDAKFQKSIQTGCDWNFDCRIRRADGNVRWIWMVGSQHLGPDGKAAFLAGIVQDITDRKETEDELKRSREEYRDLIENSGSVILRVDQDLRITFMNRFGRQFFGYTPDEIIGRNVLGTIIPRTDAKGADFAGMLQDIKEHPEKYQTNVHQNLCKDGRLVWMSWTNRPIYDDRGNFRELLAIGNDLSQLKEAEERYHSLFNTQIEGFCIIDVLFDAGNRPVDYRFLETNPAFEKQTGLHDVQGKNISELIPDNDAHWFEIYGRVALTGEPVRLENKVKALNRWYEVFAHRIGGPESRKVAVLFNDVTERRRAEEELKEYAANLEAANRELESFSYSVSHDLRAPLRAIDGFSKMILRRQGDQFDEETKRQFKQVQDNAKAMGQLIDDLLDLSKLNRQDLVVKILDVRQLVEKTWQELQNINPDRAMTLKMKTMPQALGDKALIKQVLANILGNAVKFTKTRDVAVIEVGGYEEEKDVVYFIRDNGVGFDMQFHDKLFGVFQRLHDASEYEGTGVGMALTQRIIHRHKGKIWAESKVDEGATFYFSLPQKG
ncbi:MAG: PAS domain S-box protein [Deltaproteobacteria bacterium]